MNYYPFHIGDYLSATRHLSWEEDAAYRRLLDTYYTTEKPIPSDVRSACRLVTALTDSQREAVSVVLGEFFESTETGWINSRADSEIRSMRDKQQKQRDKANARWHKPQQEHGNASALPQHEHIHATALNIDAVAMPPTPTPTPTPIKEEPPVGVSPQDLKFIKTKIPVTPEVLDWLRARKSKRAAALTETAWTGFVSQARKAGLMVEDAIAICAARGWQSFRADWARDDDSSKPSGLNLIGGV